jgi:hypothetical protein
MPRAVAAFCSTRRTVFRLEYERMRDREPLQLPPERTPAHRRAKVCSYSGKVRLEANTNFGGSLERWAIT